MGKNRNIAHIVVKGGMGHGNVDPVHRGAAKGLQQIVQKRDLFGVQLLGDKIRHDVQVGSLLQEPGCCGIVVGCGGGKGQVARVFIDAQHHEGCLDRRHPDALLHELLGQDGRGRTATANLSAARPDVAAGAGMVVIDMDLDAWPARNLRKAADARGILAVHEDQSRDVREIHIPEPGKGEFVAGCLEEEVPHALFLGAGEDHEGVGVELPGRDHGAEAIKIGVHVGGNDVHGEECAAASAKVKIGPLARGDHWAQRSRLVGRVLADYLHNGSIADKFKGATVGAEIGLSHGPVVQFL